MEKKDIKIISLDLDGTVFTTQKTITERTKAALKKAAEQGVTIVPASGRPLVGMPKELMAMDGVRYAITGNGARLIDTEEKKLLFEDLIPYDKANEIYDLLVTFDSLVEVYYDGIGFTQSDKKGQLDEYFDNPAMADYIRNTRNWVPDILAVRKERVSDSDKIHAVFRTVEEKDRAREILVNTIDGIVATGSLSNNIEVNAAGVDKGKALLKLGEILGVKREQIMACGDGDNDEAMIRAAGFGVAMANSVPGTLEAADYITDTNDNDGVAKAIEQFVLK